jgi:hypothetical protein
MERIALPGGVKETEDKQEGSAASGRRNLEKDAGLKLW